jgi:hypothetical protein
MMHRSEWTGRKANSGMAFAWMVWDRSHTGPPPSIVFLGNAEPNQQEEMIE